MALFTVSRPKRSVITRILAIRLHADWCERSRVMHQYYEDLKNRFDGQEVLFVTLDLTNNTTRHQSLLLASALGIEGILGQNSDTGQIQLATYRGKQVFAHLNPNLSFGEMESWMKKKL